MLPVPGAMLAAVLAVALSPVLGGGAFSVAVPDLRQTTTRANTAARSPIAMNTNEIPLFTVTPSAHQALVIGHRKCVTREYALARGVLHAGACGLELRVAGIGRWRRPDCPGPGPLVAAGLSLACGRG